MCTVPRMAAAVAEKTVTQGSQKSAVRLACNFSQFLRQPAQSTPLSAAGQPVLLSHSGASAAAGIGEL